MHMAARMMGLEAFYESFDHKLLLERGADLGFPLPLLRLSINTYRGLRAFGAGRAVVHRLYATGSIGAGCICATTFVKVYTLRVFKRWADQWPLLSLGTFIDDIVIAAVGPRQLLPFRLKAAVNHFKAIVKEYVRCRPAPDKGGILSPSKPVAKRVAEALGEPG